MPLIRKIYPLYADERVEVVFVQKSATEMATRHNVLGSPPQHIANINCTYQNDPDNDVMCTKRYTRSLKDSREHRVEHVDV